MKSTTGFIKERERMTSEVTTLEILVERVITGEMSMPEWISQVTWMTTALALLAGTPKTH
jgi:hypothetical protein